MILLTGNEKPRRVIGKMSHSGGWEGKALSGKKFEKVTSDQQIVNDLKAAAF